MIILLCDRATLEQIDEMLQAHGFYVKIAVDIERGIIAGGGELHADCKSLSYCQMEASKKIFGEQTGIR